MPRLEQNELFDLVLATCSGHVTRNANFKSLAELSKEMGYKSAAPVYRLIEQLTEAGDAQRLDTLQQALLSVGIRRQPAPTTALTVVPAAYSEIQTPDDQVLISEADGLRSILLAVGKLQSKSQVRVMTAACAYFGLDAVICDKN